MAACPPAEEDLVVAMGLYCISKSTVSKLCADIDERVHAFLNLDRRGLRGTKLIIFDAQEGLKRPARPMCCPIWTSWPSTVPKSILPTRSNA